ncbi:hypothetical protein SAY87_022361 [Trapa incisa]|uniref:DUF4220 domain-containing protein n=1 Tax=Trapa incisa TaxID=236973 RepID=A0AAN7Q924_9MYRT|nr:hypothetical protein SAY87_022361 [Trapa incisa]
MSNSYLCLSMLVLSVSIILLPSYFPILPSVQENFRGFMILSLSLHVILIFCAPFKKRTSNIFMVFVVWLVYLLTDWVAAFAMGLISTNYGNNSDNGAPDNAYILIFWAPILLVHMGGPNPITTFSLEDTTL